MSRDDLVAAGNPFQTWINNGSDIPAWLRSVIVEERAPNGSLLISTPVGTARVHANHVVVRHGNDYWTRPPEDFPELLRRLKAEVRNDHTAIGIGKSAQFGTKSRAKGKGSGGRNGYPPPKGSMPSIEWVHVDHLAVDPTYQRSIENAASQRLIASIAQNFDWRLCAPLVVSRRPDGTKVIIDGQHRWAAAIRRGDLPQLPCCLFSYDSPEDEARMFIVANRARKSMNRLDDFHAAIAAGDEDTLEILGLVEDAGLRVARNPAVTTWEPGEIAFISSISKSLRKSDAQIVSGALTNLALAFEGEQLTYGTSLFLALVRILKHPPENFDPDQLIPALQSRGMAEWGQKIRGLIGNEPRADIIHGLLLEALEDRTEALVA